MRSWRLSLAALIAILVPAAAVGGGRLTVLFKSMFDGSGGSNATADIGKLTTPSGTSGFSVVQNGATGEFGVALDDSGLSAATEVSFHCEFAGGAQVDTGEIQISFELAAGLLGSGFQAGVVIDDPSNDFYPAMGSGTDGHILVGGTPVAASLPLATNVLVSARLTRASVDQDWKAQVTVTPIGPLGILLGAQSSKNDGVLVGTAKHSVTAVGFVKPAAAKGAFIVDDIVVIHKAP